MKDKEIYVVGHKNPDCDSIVAAIAYAHLKQKLGVHAVARAQGCPPAETQFLLKKYHFEAPPLLLKGSCTLAEIDKDEALCISGDTVIHDALEYVLARKNKGLFIVDEKGQLKGVVSMSDLSRVWLKPANELEQLVSTIRLEHVLHVLKGHYFHQTSDFKTNGKVFVQPSLSDNAKELKEAIVIVRNTPESQRFAIESGASLLVVCGEDWLDDVTLELAKKHNTSILHCHKTVLEVSRLIYQVPSVSTIAQKEVMCFKESEGVEEVSKKMAKTRFRTYPVLNQKGKVVAAISRYHLFNYHKKELILVDHNEKTQAVDDIHLARVIEIVDHHRIAGFISPEPIRITCRIIGSTATIIYYFYKDEHVKISKNMAGLLLGGVINDTMCLKSPTTTKEDEVAVQELEKLAGITALELYQEMMNATSDLTSKENVAIMYDDFKEFRFGDFKVGIGQQPCRTIEEFESVKDRFEPYVKNIMSQQKFDLILFLFTDPLGLGSYIMAVGPKKEETLKAFLGSQESCFAAGIISRKKQVVPMVSKVLE